MFRSFFLFINVYNIYFVTFAILYYYIEYNKF